MKIQRFIICGAIFSSAKHKLSQKTHVAKPEDDFAQGPRRREESLRCSVFFIEVLRDFLFFFDGEKKQIQQVTIGCKVEN